MAGRFGEGIKVQVSAPPEGGRANRAVIEVLAAALRIRPGQVELLKGQTQARKVFQIAYLEQAEVDARLAPFL